MNEPLYRIGEAARLLELEAYVLRFWETEFPQLQPLRTPKGQRMYSEDHVALLREVKRLLYDEGLTIEGARKALERRGVTDEADIDAAQAAAPDLTSPHHSHPSSYTPLHTPSQTSGLQAPKPRWVQASLLPPPVPPDRRLLQELRTELTALRDHLLSLTPTSTDGDSA